jgi:flagellar motor switch protein FliN
MTAYQPAAFARFGDVAVRLSVELGRTELPLRDVLMLSEGSTVTLDRLTDELLDVTANGRVIARGEVVAEKGRFALRIVCLVGEDGKDVRPSGEVLAPVGDPASTDQVVEPVVPVAPAPASAASPSPIDPLTSALDDLC